MTHPPGRPKDGALPLGGKSRSDKGAPTSRKRIAVIAGDGIGKEVVPEGLRVLQAAASRFGIACQWDEFDWSSDYYLEHGRMMPENC